MLTLALMKQNHVDALRKFVKHENMGLQIIRFDKIQVLYTG